MHIGPASKKEDAAEPEMFDRCIDKACLSGVFMPIKFITLMMYSMWIGKKSKIYFFDIYKLPKYSVVDYLFKKNRI
jgi:hypothetical protein